jgi:hypothetical protein
MSTRADFYVGRGEIAEWLGSIAFDGYPGGNPKILFASVDENNYRERVGSLAQSCSSHWTSPEDGWPWPWETSRTTDYAYAFDDGQVWYSCFGRSWQTDPESDLSHESSEEVPFPDMTDRMNVQLFGPRSGLLVLTL